MNLGYNYKFVDGVGIFSLPLFDAQPGISSGFSSRFGGISTGSIAEMNLSFTREEEPRLTTMENYRIFCRAANIPVSSMVMDSYEHGTTVRRVSASDCGKGFDRPSLPDCDGLVTNDPSVTLMTGHADCMAIYAYNPVTRSVGLAHAGWRGALGRMGASLVTSMMNEFGSAPADLLCGVGPSICPRCFEVGRDVAELFWNEFPSDDIRGINSAGKDTIDLWKVVLSQLLELGVREDRLQFMGVCTMEDNRLYSYRRDKGKSGGMTAFIRLTAQ